MVTKTPILAVLLALQTAAPAAAAAQDTLSAPAVDTPLELPVPASLETVETARSRRCVPLIERLDELNARMAPSRARVQRLAQLVDAIALEDTTRAAPFDSDDPVERAVREWFDADLAIAQQFLATGDTTLQARRTQGREAILERVREAGARAAAEADAQVQATGTLLDDSRQCLGAMLVRPAVLEACGGSNSVLCREARGDTTTGRFRLVGSAAEIWDVETIRPWGTPARLGFTVQGSLGGASSNASATRGNVTLVVGIEPIVQDRSAAAPEDLARLQASLDSLGLTFEHPRFLLVPGLAIRLEVGEPLGGESYYFLHFGDLSDPVEDVVWSASAASSAPLAYRAPIREPVLDRLAAGEPLTLTAVRFPQPGVMEGDAVYQLDLTNIGQAAAVTALREYMATRMQADFTALVPPPPEG